MATSESIMDTTALLQDCERTLETALAIVRKAKQTTITSQSKLRLLVELQVIDGGLVDDEPLRAA